MQGRAYREGKVEVPKERGHKSIGSYEEDSAGALELPIFLRPRHFLVHALYNLDCAQQEGKPREPQGQNGNRSNRSDRSKKEPQWCCC